MAAGYRGRCETCGGLCQHPGCWKSTKTVYSSPKDYLLKMERSKRKEKERRLCDSVSFTNSYTEDGLPTLKIKTLECQAVSKSKSSDPLILPNVPTMPNPEVPAKKKIHYIQLLLQDDDSYTEDREITYAPILLWKPGGPKRNATVKVPPNTITNDKSPQVDMSGFPGIPTKLEVSQDTRSSMTMPRTDLTNALPPEIDSLKLKEAQVERIRTLQKLAFGGTESLSCLNEIDLPLPILDEIIHQLRSESSMSLIDSARNTPPAIHQLSRVHHNLHDPASTPQISSRMRRTIKNLSASRLSRAAGKGSPRRMESFSRQLSIKPHETLQRFYAPLRKLESVKLQSGQFDVEEMLSHVGKNHSNQWQIYKGVEDLKTLLPYSRRAITDKRSSVVIPHMKRGLESVHPITSSERNMEMIKKPGYRPAFGHTLSKQRLQASANSSLNYSEESSVVNEVIMKLPAVKPIPRPPVNSCCDSSIPSLPQSRATHNLATPISPDYMMMTAKLSSGKLILTDRRKGATFVRKLTMSDSELNAESDFNLERKFLPSPVQELKDEGGSKLGINEGCSDMEVDDDVFEDAENKEEMVNL